MIWVVRRRWIWLVCGLLMLGLCVPSWVSAEKRVAFVVGINEYSKLGLDKQLKTAVNDAEGISSILENLGYTVRGGNNLTHQEFFKQWDDVLREFTGSETFVFFFSGHGIQINRSNYLLPSDIPSPEYGRENKQKRKALSVSELLEDLSSGDRPKPKHAVVILDACRENPFIPNEYRGVRIIGGLAYQHSEGIFVMYSAADKSVALDRLSPKDEAPYSVYTRTLLPLMGQKGLNIQTLNVKLRKKVYVLAKEFNHFQKPAYYDGFLDDFCFAGCQSLNEENGISDALGDKLAPTSLAQRPNPASRMTSELLESKGGPRMVTIPSGAFIMGSPLTEENRHDDEGPQHHVTVNAFDLGETEVTFSEWDRCVEAMACESVSDEGWGRMKRPVINVSWYAVQTYIRWLNRHLNLDGQYAYRLPTEAEWEFAAKSGSQQHRWAGTSQKSELEEYVASHRNEVLFRITAEVGSKAPNDFGLYDLSGNVWEWVEDCYDAYAVAPKVGLANGMCKYRVKRGGAWSNFSEYHRSAKRGKLQPDDARDTIGFRLARTSPP